MSEVYFIRHGETDWNKPVDREADLADGGVCQIDWDIVGRIQGRSDIPLNSTGIVQSINAARFLSQLPCPIGLIVSSSLIRARDTGKTISDLLSVPIEMDSRLVERDLGAIEGMTTAEIALSDPDKLFEPGPRDWQGRRLPRGAETVEAVAARYKEAVLEWLSKHPLLSVLFVAHSAGFRALIHDLTGGKQTVHLANAVPYRAQPGRVWTVDRLTI